jgi:hypothetical protein
LKMIGLVKKARRDDTLLTVCFSLREETQRVPAVYSKSRRDDTLLTVCFSLRMDGLQTQKSRRDDTFLIVDKYATYKYMANNNVSSLVDFLFVASSIVSSIASSIVSSIVSSARKLKHTVNKVSSLRDLSNDENLSSKSLRDFFTNPIIFNFQFSMRKSNQSSQSQKSQFRQKEIKS